MGATNRFVIDEAAQRVDMAIGSRTEWTFKRGDPDLFDKKGDTFVVRSDGTGTFGAGVRAGFPHAFYYDSEKRLMTWTYIWDSKVTRIQWQCTP